MNRMDGKIAIVTGGTQGLGAAIANAFARSGAAGIVTCGRNVEKGMKVADYIRTETSVPVAFLKADLSKIDDCKSIIVGADQIFGRVDVLVNAAAITDRGNILDTSPELFDDMMAVNIRAPFFLSQESVKLMIREGIEGSILNIGSTSAMTGQPFISAYCTSKGALETFTRNTAFALMRNRIRVNQLNIGWMSSEGEDRIQRLYHGAKDGWLEKASAQQPFGRLVDPAEVARAVTFFSSEDAGLMTGAVVHFDQSVWGGYEAGPPVPSTPLSL